MFQPVVRFLVCSDVHYCDEPSPVREYFEKYVKMGYELAEQDENYKTVDALYIVGDFLNTGTEAQFLAFRDSLNKVVREETKVVPVLAGHEFLHAAGEEEGVVWKLINVLEPEFTEAIQGQPHAVERLNTILGCEEDTHFVINGFHFIAISSTRVSTAWYENYTPEKMDWLLTQLREACEDTPTRPVFLFQHIPPTATIYGTDGWSKADLCLPLVNFPQVIDFAGHSHTPCTDPRTIFQRDFTCVGTGALSCIEYNDYNATQGWSVEEGNECAQALMVEANQAGDVLIKVIDVVEGVIREERLIERPWDPDSFVYTDERIRTESAPEFSADADLNITCTEQKLLVDFPQAIGETEQYTVTLRRAKDQSVVARIVTLSKQIYYRPPQRLTVSFDLLPAGEYLAEVRPRGYFGSQGSILSVPFSIPAR